MAVSKVLVTSSTSLVTLICKTATHHWLLGLSLADHMMTHLSAHSHAIVLDNGNATRALKVRLFTHALMILLRLNNVTAKHLGILDLNLRIVENIIIVVDVLYNLYRLVPFLFLWF